MDEHGADYQLSEAENDRIFREAITPELLTGPVPQSRPTAVFLVGQPGAGKTRVGAQIGAVLDRAGGFVEVDTDLYKPYHPAYDDLMRRDGGRDMARHTRADGRAWMARVQDHVREHKLNALIHDTVQDPEAFAESLRAYRAAGHRVEVVVMGVPQALSRQGVLDRYHQQVSDRGAGRLTVAANAEASYRGILGGARLVDEHRLADTVAVYRRGEADPRYRNHLTAPREWAESPHLQRAIETERTRPLSPDEAREFRATHALLRTALGPEWHDELTAIAELARPLTEAAAAATPSVETDRAPKLTRAAPGSHLPPLDLRPANLRRAELGRDRGAAPTREVTRGPDLGPELG